MEKKILVSGIRPTGDPHLGNYYGAMKGLIDYQKSYNAFFFIADIHSLTTHPNPQNLSKNIIEVAKNYLAAGLDPESCTLYTQSSIASEVCELHTYLSMVMPLGELLRVPTFKEKARKHPDNVNYGLVGYPVLMTSDILIHKGEVVPVGDDQLVHLEIARTIVRRFNQYYGNIFHEPHPVKENAVRIPSLSGNGKMSKSDDEDTYISMEDANEVIQAKIRKAYSDPKRIYKHDPGHPTASDCNVYHLHTYFTDQASLQEIEKKCKEASIGCVDCKRKLSESVVAIVEPFRKRKAELRDDYVLDVLEKGKQRAKESAEKVLYEVRKAIGLLMF